MELVNDIGWPAQMALLPDRDGRETLLVVVKGTFTLERGGCRPADEPVPLTLADEHSGEPGLSTVRCESDFALEKPATDVLLLGHAWAPRGRAKESRVKLQAGPAGCEARVHGDRHWSVVLGLPKVSSPEPFERIPLCWERAFGGTQIQKGGDEVEGAEERNPIGTGFVKGRGASAIDGVALPNIEDPSELLKRPGQRCAPAGFGVVGRHWLPRRPLFGTYDEAWKRDRMPLPPVDLDPRAFCAAPQPLQARPHLRGGETVVAEGVSPDGPLRFELPRVAHRWEVRIANDWTGLTPLLDTLILEPDEGRVALVWRARLDVHNRLRQVRGVRLRAEPA